MSSDLSYTFDQPLSDPSDQSASFCGSDSLDQLAGVFAINNPAVGLCDRFTPSLPFDEHQEVNLQRKQTPGTMATTNQEYRDDEL